MFNVAEAIQSEITCNEIDLISQNRSHILIFTVLCNTWEDFLDYSYQNCDYVFVHMFLTNGDISLRSVCFRMVDCLTFPFDIYPLIIFTWDYFHKNKNGGKLFHDTVCCQSRNLVSQVAVAGLVSMKRV